MVAKLIISNSLMHSESIDLINVSSNKPTDTGLKIEAKKFSELFDSDETFEGYQLLSKKDRLNIRFYVSVCCFSINSFNHIENKTGNMLIRYRQDEVVAVIDPEKKDLHQKMLLALVNLYL